MISEAKSALSDDNTIAVMYAKLPKLHGDSAFVRPKLRFF